MERRIADCDQVSAGVKESGRHFRRLDLGLGDDRHQAEGLLPDDRDRLRMDHHGIDAVQEHIFGQLVENFWRQIRVELENDRLIGIIVASQFEQVVDDPGDGSVERNVENDGIYKVVNQGKGALDILGIAQVAQDADVLVAVL